MNNIVLNGGIQELEKYSCNALVKVVKDSTLNLVNLMDDIDLNIKISNGVKLILNIFDFTSDKKINLVIDSDDSSTFDLNVSFINNGKYELNIDDNLYGSDITSNVRIRGINEESGTATIIMNGVVAGETHNNVLNEYAKILNKSDSSNVMIPNLIVNTNDVVANHGVSIGSFDKEALFYLESKGIDKHTGKKVIEEGFLLSVMDEELKERIKSILLGR